jgi:hypothetical protein
MNIVSYTKKFHSKTVDDVGMYNICIEVDRAQYNHARLGQILLGGIKQLTKYGVVYNRWDTSVFEELYVTTLPWTISQYKQNINHRYIDGLLDWKHGAIRMSVVTLETALRDFKVDVNRYYRELYYSQHTNHERVKQDLNTSKEIYMTTYHMCTSAIQILIDDCIKMAQEGKFTMYPESTGILQWDESWDDTLNINQFPEGVLYN